MTNFLQNIPGVWIAPEKDGTVPLTFGMGIVLGAGAYTLRIGTSGLYRLRVNGVVAAYGPARSPHGFGRVDEIALAGFLTRPRNDLTLELVAYTTGNFYIPKAAPRVAAGIYDAAGALIAAPSDWEVFHLDARDWQVPKMSFQRDRMESYDFAGHPEQLGWYRGDGTGLRPGRLEATGAPEQGWLPRGVPLPDLTGLIPAVRIGGGKLTRIEDSIPDPNALRDRLARDFQWREGGCKAGEPESYTYYDLGADCTGFWRCRLRALCDCEIVLSWDELKGPGGVFSIQRFWWAHNFIRLRLAAGQELEFESFEVYTARYFAVLQLSGHAEVEAVAMREYAFDRKLLRPEPEGLDANGLRLYRAAVETFRQNTLDTFMDCPGRERGAWLCDSFFTARAAWFLTGSSEVETTFLENFLLPESFDGIPAGQLPMCYPADGNHGEYIPQWTLWFWLEMGEYCDIRRGRRDFPREFADRLRRTLANFEAHVNEFGLLEELPGWNIIEWSKAQDYISGVHFPTNMLYCAVLRLAAKWLGETHWRERADAITGEIVRRAFNGRYFIDHAVRTPDGLVAGEGASEICQYLADFCGVVDCSRGGWREWRDGILRRPNPEELAEVNMFVGRMLRFDRLRAAGMYEVVAEEAERFLGYQADTTGTLWEMAADNCSCCHGFAGFMAEIIAECHSPAHLCGTTHP